MKRLWRWLKRNIRDPLDVILLIVVMLAVPMLMRACVAYQAWIWGLG
jgi:hypothetical protein